VKERLTGAIILVALIVLLVPELLTGPPQLGRTGPSVRATTELAGAKPAPVRSVTLPLMTGAGSRSAAIDGASSAPAQRAPAPLPAAAARSAPASAPPHPAAAAKSDAASARDAPPPAEPHPAHSPPRPKTKPIARSSAQTPRAPAKAQAQPTHRTASGAHWGIQLGVFAYHADALRLAHRVHARGVPVHITSLTLRGRRLWRVTAGPVKSRAAALKLARRLRSLGLKGNLRRQ
jgi:cell division septation protein DedD